MDDRKPCRATCLNCDHRETVNLNPVERSHAVAYGHCPACKSARLSWSFAPPQRLTR